MSATPDNPGKSTISENVSEKPKRGRPHAIPPHVLAVHTGFFPDVRTTHGKQNIFYQQRALGVLMDDPGFYWITGGSGDDIMAGRTPPMRRTILQALGRILDDDELKAIAAEICRLKLKTAPATALIRRHRRAQSRPSALALTGQLARCIDRYLADHPATTWEQVGAALENVAYIVEQTRMAGDGEQSVAHEAGCCVPAVSIDAVSTGPGPGARSAAG